MSKAEQAAAEFIEAVKADDENRGVAALANLAVAFVAPFERIAAALERIADKA